MNAPDYFYPNGMWGGYNRFFSPSINSRLGTTFVASVRRALEGDEPSQSYAIWILSNTHKKKVNKAGAKPPFPEIDCVPTAEAQRAIEILSQNTKTTKPKTQHANDN